ncbi:MAG: histidinol-phosphate aminotransferase [Nitrospinaceae bacterium]|nr:MAG: histidinol-phosphate aminotransferase [Nitrospinaceae bacterium]
MATVDLTNLVREKVKSLKAYQVENFDCEIKLHANENPFPPPAELLRQFDESLKEIQLNRYPDPDCLRLKAAITEVNGFPAESLVIGNGSDELLHLILQIFCDAGESYSYPDPTFGMYSIIGKGMGLVPQPFPLKENWDFNGDDFLKFLNEKKARVVFFSYPNNPTGNCYSAKEIEKVIENFQGIVVLDEAYFDFAHKTFCQSIKEHNNLIVLRSLSKIGLAGLRVGYGIANPLIIDQINKVRLPYNSNTVSQEFATRLLNNFAPVQEQIDVILRERDRLIEGLSQLDFITVFPTDSNFILFRVHDDGDKLFKQLMKNGILVRNLSAHPLLKNCLRITGGTAKENDRFLAQLGKIGGTGNG